jgi:iron complex outermembrane receptor protein
MIQTNNYIKFRDISLGYRFPAKFSRKIGMQGLGVSVYARNLFYLYKTVNNIDSEAMLGTGNDSWRENSNFPMLRTYGFKLNVSF